MALLGDIRPFPRRASSPAPVTRFLPPHSQIEVLLSLPDVRVVEFKPFGLDSNPDTKNEYALVHVEPGTLSWASRFERTIAVGSLRIYRAPGSIAFLNCQNAIRPILPKSQAWCVDGESKFVLGSPPLFWRVELPNKSQDELLRVEELKKVLDQVSRFEKTPCPFRRNFHIEPTPIPTKLIKKTTPASTCESRETSRTDGNQIKDFQNYSLETKFDRKLDSDPSEDVLSLDPNSESPHSRISESVHHSTEKKTHCHEISGQNNNFEVEKSYFDDITNITSDPTEQNSINTPCQSNSSLGRELPERSAQLLMAKEFEKKRTHSASYYDPRSFTSHPIQFPNTVTTSKDCETSSSKSLVDESHSESSSSGSFHSLRSWHTPHDSPQTSHKISYQSSISNNPIPYDNYLPPSHSSSTINVSDTAVTAKGPEIWNNSSSYSEINDRELTPSSKTKEDLVEKLDENKYEVPRRVVSDYSRYSPNCRPIDGTRFSRSEALAPALSYKMLHLAHRVPTKIAQKTSEILLTPPNHLIQFMLGIASRIASGEWRDVLFDFGDPIHWDFEEDYGESEWLESEYRNSNRVRIADVKISGGWEFD